MKVVCLKDRVLVVEMRSAERTLSVEGERGMARKRERKAQAVFLMMPLGLVS